MKIFFKIVFILSIQYSINAQDFITKKSFENGNLKTTEQQLENNEIEQIHYFPNGKIRSKGIIKNDIYTDYKGFDEDGTLLALIKMTKNQDIELYTINKFHTNGKPLQNITYVKDNYIKHNYLPTGIWTSFSSNGQVIEEVSYNPILTKVDCFKTGTTYYTNGSKKVELSFNPKTNLLVFEQYYPTGETYLKATFSYSVLLGKYDESVEKSKLLNLLRDPGLINNYFYRKKNAITYYTYNYPNGNPAIIKNRNLTTVYKLDASIFNPIDEKFIPVLKGFAKCNPTSKQKDCQPFYTSNSEERLEYIPNRGRYIIMADNLTKYTRVYNFSKKQNGTITYYGINKTPLKVMTYKSGKLNGLYTTRHHITGEITSQGQYLNGKKEGLHREFSYLGVLELSQNYSNGKKDGLFQYSGTVGDFWTSTFNSNIKDGEAVLKSVFTNETLLVGAYKTDMKTGKWKMYNFDFERYYPNSVLYYGVDFEYFNNDKIISKIEYY